MNKQERKEVVRAMEILVRNIVDEDVQIPWYELGVADGDIVYEHHGAIDEVDDWYIDDDNLRDLMNLFMRTMKRAYMFDGLYCDGVLAKGKREH